MVREFFIPTIKLDLSFRVNIIWILVRFWNDLPVFSWNQGLRRTKYGAVWYSQENICLRTRWNNGPIKKKFCPWVKKNLYDLILDKIHVYVRFIFLKSHSARKIYTGARWNIGPIVINFNRCSISNKQIKIATWSLMLHGLTDIA